MAELIKKSANMLVNVLLVLLILAAVPLLVGHFLPNQRLPLVGGYQVLVVQGGSMEPAIKLGSVIVIRAIDPTKVKVGDVVTFRPPTSELAKGSPPAIATHRVIEVNREKVYGDIGAVSFRTKGDANKEPDMQLISGASVMGKVMVAVPHLGYLVRLIRTPVGLALMILVPGLVLAAGGTAKVAAKARGRRDSAVAQR